MLRFRERLVLVTTLTLACLALLPTAAHAAGKITNGTRAGDAIYARQFQSVVALVRYDGESQFDGQFCAGALIDDRHVLTAAHCMMSGDEGPTRFAPSAFGVLAGTRSLDTSSLDRRALVPVQAIFVNRNFNPDTLRWDAAVLRLSRPITGVPTLGVMSHAESEAFGLGDRRRTGAAAGWGDTNPRTDYCCFPSVMRTAPIPIQPDGICRTNLARASHVRFSPEFQFCGGRLGTRGQLGADTCQGDSGGPLVVTIDGSPRLAGVTSFGLGCGEEFYGVYARATALGDWLRSIPGALPEDDRAAVNGPGDLARPTAVGTPRTYHSARIQVTPAATGARPTGYALYLRSGTGANARDIFLGTSTRTDGVVPLPATRTRVPYLLILRPRGPFGEGPSYGLRTRPRVDSARPTIPTRVAIARMGGRVTVTWRPSSDGQSGVAGYLVQRLVRGRWHNPLAVDGRVFRFSGLQGRVRVRAVDHAGNLSAWTASRAY